MTTQNKLQSLFPKNWQTEANMNILQNDKFKTFMPELLKLDNQNELRPPLNLVFNAFQQTPKDKVKVVIIGQDPYPKPNDAMGMSFSVNPTQPTPRSLKNMYKELKDDLDIDNLTATGDLTAWTKQGVLLLNTVLTTKLNETNYHKNSPWRLFTTEIIQELNQTATPKHPIVFLLWGNQAKEMKKYLTNPNVFIVEGVHPSPLSANRGFFGSKPFSKINNLLKTHNQTPINWKLPKEKEM